jgi:hypothetical protein
VPAIRLDQVNLVVRDVRASRGFYSRHGLDFGVDDDPDGSSVGLMSPIDPDRRRPPPVPA